MGRRRTRRQSHGSAWHWKQTNCWYYTLPGTKKRVALYDEDGRRIRGIENKKAAQLALARIQVDKGWRPESPPVREDDWLVARVCSEYLQYCERRLANATISKGHQAIATWILNDLCKYCGAMSIVELTKAHIQAWLKSHDGWLSPATHRSAIVVVLAAFNYAADNFGISKPLQGLKKPQAQPRLQSLSQEDEAAAFKATDEPFRNFISAALHTGLRPFCELAKMTADNVVEGDRGMMWRVYSSKTKKTRKIPVRPEVAALTRKLMKTAPPGSGTPLFRNSQGNPWKRLTGIARLINIKKKLGWDKDPVRSKFSCYACRHTFAHRMLSGYWNSGKGCSIETLAELMGDTPKVVFDHYGKEWGQHYQEPLWAAVGVSAAVNGKASATGAPRRRDRGSSARAKR